MTNPSDPTRPRRPVADLLHWRTPPHLWRWCVPEPAPGMIHIVLRSQAMQRDIGAQIYLPPSYHVEPDRRFPVVYFLHGAFGSERSAFEFGDVVVDAVQSGRIGDVIYVFPNGGHFSNFRNWREDNVLSETWMIRELLPRIDDLYRTHGDRAGRAICGFSMGGDAALRFGMQYPELFSAAASMVASIDMGADKQLGPTLEICARANAARLVGSTRLLAACGARDKFYDAHQSLRTLLEQLGIGLDYLEFPELKHQLHDVKELCGATVVHWLAERYAPAR